MKRKLVLALAMMSALGIAASGANAQSDEKKDEKKPEFSQLILVQSDEKKDEKKDEQTPRLIADDEKKDAEKPQLTADGDDNFPKGSSPELIA